MSIAAGLAEHLHHPRARGHIPLDSFTGAAGGTACGDLVRVSLALEDNSEQGVIADAGFDARGCASAIAAGSAVVELVRGKPMLHAARLGAAQIAGELGGLSPARAHGAALAADALHRALGAAARARAALAPQPGRILVAMSGGVDSAVAALLLAQAGSETIGVTLELWADPDNDGERSCCSPQAVRGARELAHALCMPHLSIDLRAEFRQGVVAPWLSGYRQGLTPNPCIRCNGEVRLDAMLDLARRLGAEGLATGHYARIERPPAADPGASARALLRVAHDESKDQSYALAALPLHSLERMRFPLGELTKGQVRELARRSGLAVADRHDSQDLCFLAGTDRRTFLARHGGLGDRPGPILDRRGRQLGRHAGAYGFTVGQRHGLGLGGGPPLYVLDVDAAANRLTVGARSELLSRRLPIRDATLHRDGRCIDAVKVRYRGRRLPCERSPSLTAGHHELIEVDLIDPVERTAPGQLACLYAGDVIVGHGTVASP